MPMCGRTGKTLLHGKTLAPSAAFLEKRRALLAEFVEELTSRPDVVWSEPFVAFVGLHKQV